MAAAAAAAAEEESKLLKLKTTISSSDDDDQPPRRPCMTAPSSPVKQPISMTQKLGHRNSHSFHKDLSLIVETTISTSSSYTSLRDLIHTNGKTLTSQIKSPTFCYREEDLPIRNRLVKQAACAYLLPKASPRPNKNRQGWFRSTREDEVLLDSSCSEGCLGFVRYSFDTFVTEIKKRWGNGDGDSASDHLD